MRVLLPVAIAVIGIGTLVLFALGTGTDSAPAATSADAERVLALARSQGAGPLGPAPEADPALVALGEALFFDPILSGNRDISCASCHHPEVGSGDGLPLSVGTGGTGDGPERLPGPDRPLIPRNAPPIYNRGHGEWRTMFWDGRVEEIDGEFRSPAGDVLPGGLDSVLAVQAMFPPSSRQEMRGSVGDSAADGTPNELAMIPDGDLEAIWAGLTLRVVATPGYAPLLAAAFPGRDPSTLSFADLANAIAAYEATAFVADSSPWDAFLAGDLAALDRDELAGAEVFYGEGSCSACHSGVLMTDQDFHATGVPQIGPGKDDAAPGDLGRGGRDGASAEERYAFRTPSLRNVAITGPWMHDGAYDRLADAVRHMSDAVSARREFRPPVQAGIGRLSPESEDQRAVLDDTAADFSAASARLSDAEIADVVAFLSALTDPATRDGAPEIPDSVPSGLTPPNSP